jgi:hypothetical protein
VDLLDDWDQALVACALVSNEPSYTKRALQTVSQWVEHNWPDVILVDQRLELI